MKLIVGSNNEMLQNQNHYVLKHLKLIVFEITN